MIVAKYDCWYYIAIDIKSRAIWVQSSLLSFIIIESSDKQLNQTFYSRSQVEFDSNFIWFENLAYHSIQLDYYYYFIYF